MDKLNIVILGDGLLGSEILSQTNWDNISRKKDGFDISDTVSWNFKKYNVIVNCIANTDTNSNDRELHWLVNYKFVYNLIEYCNLNNIKLIHISTEYLYSGSINNASENDVPVHCNNWYGYTKLLGDGLIQLMSKNYLICRCMHKPNPFPYNIAWIDQIGNFDYVNVISKMIINSIESNLNGVYNIGTELKNMHDLAIRTIKNTTPSFSPEWSPKNISMSIDKYTNTFYNPFFSIAIPTYEYNNKGVEFLSYSFDKISKQTFNDFEIVISDHSLNNDIENLCNEWNKTLNIKYFKNNKGRGIISPNINFAMNNCRGKYIKVLFQDDFLYNENSLEKTYKFINSNDDIKWLMTSFYHSKNGIDMERPLLPIWNNIIWTGKNTMGCPSGMTIKNQDIIYFDENLNWMMDVDYYKKMFDRYGEPHILNDITVVNRTWGERLSDTINITTISKETEIMFGRYAK